MVEYYKQQDLINAKKIKTRTIIPLIVAFVAYAVFCVFIIVSFVNLPYNDKRETILEALLLAFTVFICAYAYIYAGIKVKRAVKYYKLIEALEIGLKVESVGVLKEFSSALETYNGVDVKTIGFKVYSERFTSEFDRFVYIPFDKDFPEIEIGQKVKFYTVGNVLHSYEII